MIGEIIGSYRIVSELGRGGMGVVYRAEHVQLGRPAAVKMLLSQLSSDASIVQRFFNEARAASAIDHPGIVEIYDFGRHGDGRAYIVMALLKGESLEQRLRRGPLPPHDGAAIAAQAVAALAAAHARGIVHRDLKPDNLFLVPNDLMPGGIQVKLLDFGIAKLADDQTTGFKTQTGALIGTPAYMSPEQCMGRADLDHRTDIYAVGCILFHLFCGRPPFTSDQGTGMMIAAHIRDAAPDPRSFNRHLPEPLANIVLRCLEKDPAARYQSATELRNALVAAGANAPLSRPPGAEQYAATLAAPLLPSAPPSSVHPAGGHPAGGAAATTRAGAAAQLVGAPGAASRSRSRAALVAGGLVVALAGAGVAVAVTRGMHDDGTAAGSGPAVLPPAPGERAGSPALPPAPGERAGAAMAPPPASPTTSGSAAPPPASPTTSGSAAPPPAAGGAAIATDRPPEPSRATRAATAPRFHLGATSYAPGEAIEIRFALPVSSKPQHRAWITVVEADRPASAYDTWSYLDDGATSATLQAPAQPGRYQVRLHTDYPARAFNVQGAVALTVKAAAEVGAEVTPASAQRFTVAARTLRPGAMIKLAFAAALHAAPGERFWITVVPAGAADTAWGAYDYVPAGARHMQLAAPDKPGDYEVRLHANYPTRTTNLVHRVAIRVADG